MDRRYYAHLIGNANDESAQGGTARLKSSCGRLVGTGNFLSHRVYDKCENCGYYFLKTEIIYKVVLIILQIYSEKGLRFIPKLKSFSNKPCANLRSIKGLVSALISLVLQQQQLLIGSSSLLVFQWVLVTYKGRPTKMLKI